MSAQHRIFLWVTWGSLVSSIIIYLVIIQISDLSDSPSEYPTRLKTVFGAISVVFMLIATVARKKIIKPRVNDPNETGNIVACCIIIWALGEAVAIFGLVLAFLGAPVAVYGAFFITSFVTMMFLAPNFAQKSSKH